MSQNTLNFGGVGGITDPTTNMISVLRNIATNRQREYALDDQEKQQELQNKQQEFRNKLVLDQNNRQQTKFNELQQDRGASQLFNKEYMQTKNVLAPGSMNQIISKKQVADMSYTPAESNVLSGVDLSANPDVLMNALKSKGVDNKTATDIVNKTRMQMAVSNMASNPNSNSVISNVGRAKWAMDDVVSKYGTVPDNVQAKYNTIQAAGIAANKAEQNRLTTLLMSAQKQRTSLVTKMAEYNDKIANSGKSTNSKSKWFSTHYLNPANKLLTIGNVENTYKHKVSPFGSETDADTAAALKTMMVNVSKNKFKKDLNSDAASYVYSNLFSKGVLGNNWRGDSKTAVTKALSQYYNALGKMGSGKPLYQNTVSKIYNSQINGLDTSIKEYTNKLKLVGKNSNEVRLANMKTDLANILRNNNNNNNGSIDTNNTVTTNPDYGNGLIKQGMSKNKSLVKLLIKNPGEFSKEYTNLGSVEQAKVDNVLSNRKNSKLLQQLGFGIADNSSKQSPTPTVEYHPGMQVDAFTSPLQFYKAKAKYDKTHPISNGENFIKLLLKPGVLPMLQQMF